QALDEVAAGELVELWLPEMEEPAELLGALLTAAPAPAATSAVRLDVPDGAGRLWWRDGWVRVAVADGVATLRGPRLLAAGQRAVLARGDTWTVTQVGEPVAVG